MAVIAIDCDDTLALTNLTICTWHNDTYGTNLSISDFHHFQYWRNPGWGNKTETMRKVHAFNVSPAWHTIPVIQSAIAATKQLKEQGHTLIMITARMSSEAEPTRDWVEKLFPDTFDKIFFTSAFESRASELSDGQQPNASEHTIQKGREPGRLQYESMPVPKSQVCKKIGAKLLVDDSLQNADDVWKNAGVPVALYGDWQWNKRALNREAEKSEEGYEDRRRKGVVDEMPLAVLPEGITRCLDWDAVLRFAETVL